MKTLPLLTLVVAVGLCGCATTKQDSKAASADREALQSCQGKVADLEKDASLREKEASDRKAEEARHTEEVQGVKQALAAELDDESKKGIVTISQIGTTLTVSVGQDVLFDAGRADLKEPGKKLLERVAKLVKAIDNRSLVVEAHSDNGHAKSRDRFPTNWELTTARAAAVARLLQDKGVEPKRLGATGFSEFRPIAANDTDPNRQKNRRVDLVLAPEPAADKSAATP